MQRFVAFAWRPGGGTATVARELAGRLRREQADWDTALDRDGMLVLQTGFTGSAARVYPMLGDRGRLGVVLGVLFERAAVQEYEPGDAVHAVAAGAAPDGRRVVATGGAHLVDRYWGRYVATWSDEATGTSCVLRDPSGAMPCFFTERHGITVFFSHAEDCARLGFADFTVDWQQVARFLHFGFSQRGHTGLRQVTNLLPGHCREVGAQSSRTRCCWNAVERAGEPVHLGVDEAAVRLRRTLLACVGAWASCFDRLLLRFSGGLDSSLVLASLVQAGHAEQVRCVHFHGPCQDSEEEHHARRAAAHAGVSLLRHRLEDPELSAGTLATMPRSAVPLDYHYGLGAARFEAQLAQETGAGAFVSGHGGDEVLNATNTPFGAVDFVLQQGPRPGLPAAALDAALLSRTSLWSVLALVMRHGILRRPLDPLAPSASLVPPHVALPEQVVRGLDVRDVQHPLLDEAELPPGKLLHLFAVVTVDLNAALAPAAHRVEQVYPLYSQPLIELCLGLPTHLLSVSGMNRGLARRAFVGLAPDEVLARSSKASGDSHHERIAVNNLALVRELLLDGVLVRQGLLHRAGIEQALSGERSAAAAGRSQLLGFVYLEDWVRRWVSPAGSGRVTSGGAATA